jgi:pilus assembly protein Flp/PilA
MRNLINKLHMQWRRLRDDESGATAIEYGIMAVGISIAIITTVLLLGPELNNTFNLVLTELQNAATP